ncbi:MAG: DUF4215 domain-containing protein [Nannocystaceae bacterium]
MTRTYPLVPSALTLTVGGLLLLGATPAQAAEVLVLSNNGAPAVVTDFTANTMGHNYTAHDADTTPTLDQLNQYEAVLLFENGLFSNAPNVGDRLAEWYGQGGKCIVIGTFYWQDRSDNPKYANNYSWGALEDLDVFTGLAGGSEYNSDSLDPNSIVAHPITDGVMALSAHSYRGGVQAKDDTQVLALWSTLNSLNEDDPLIGVREDDNGGKFVGISIFPDYESHGDYGNQFTGDFHVLWENALTWCASTCGDGKMSAGEECDDGNNVDGDGCTATCKVESCGDGVVNNGDAEQCDDGNDVNTDDCTDSCLSAACGDGYVHEGVEACDDGNDVNDDACTNMCTVPTCGDGVIQDGEACDDGNPENTDACLATCVEASCGDGFLQDGVEACDDSNDDNTDDCIDTCEAASCGDGYVQAGVESCDDGNADNGDGCLDTCVIAACGDGYVYAGIEECDDGNDVDDDDCANDCTIPSGTTTDDSGGATTSGGETTTTGDDTETAGTSDSGTGTGTGGETTGDVSTTGDATTTTDGATGSATDGGTAGVDEEGCGCTTDGADEPAQGLLGLLSLGLLALTRRRRRA